MRERERERERERVSESILFYSRSKMPVNQWNWYRAVGTGNDHKTWLADNPQVPTDMN